MDTTTPVPAFPETVVPIVTEYIGVKPGFCGGKPHLLGHRVKVQHIAVWRERKGMSPEEIVATYPSLSLAAVFAALAYYHDHRLEIDADIAADEQFAAEMKKAEMMEFLREAKADAEAGRTVPAREFLQSLGQKKKAKKA